MILSRTTALMRLHGFTERSFLQNKLHKGLENSRGAHTNWGYRKQPEDSAESKRYSTLIGGFFWWWVTWHLITDYEELLAHPFPNPADWTDEELGIPPLEE